MAQEAILELFLMNLESVRVNMTNVWKRSPLKDYTWLCDRCPETGNTWGCGCLAFGQDLARDSELRTAFLVWG